MCEIKLSNRGIFGRLHTRTVRNRQTAVGVGAKFGMIPVANGVQPDTKSSRSPEHDSRIRRMNHPHNNMHFIDKYHQLLQNDNANTENGNVKSPLKSPFKSPARASKSKQESQDWSKVDSVAYVILVTSAFECFLEGIAYTLTLQDDIVAGFTVLFAMVFACLKIVCLLIL